MKRLDSKKGRNIILNYIIVLFTGILIGATMVYFVRFALNKKKDKDYFDINEGVTLLTGTDKTSAIKDIEKSIDFISNKPIYMVLDTSSEGYNTYVYNTNGDAFMQSSDTVETTLFLKDKPSISIINNEVDTSVKEGEEKVSTLVLESSIDYLTILKNIKKYCNENSRSVEIYGVDSVNNDENSGYKTYEIRFSGEEQIRALYKTNSESFDNNMWQEFKEYFGEDWNETIVYSISTNRLYTEDEFEFGTYSYYISKGEVYKQWEQKGYIEVNDWEIPEDIRGIDIINNKDNSANLANAVEEVGNIVKNMIQLIYSES